MKKSDNKYSFVIIAVLVSFFVYGTAFQLSGAALELLKEHFSLPVETVGYLVSAYSLGRIIMLCFTGRLIKKFRPKYLLLVGMALPAAMLLVVPNSTVFWLAFALTALMGMGHALADTSGMRIFLLSRPDKYSSILSMSQFAFSAGGMLAPVLLAFLTTRGLGFGWLYIALGCFTLLVFAGTSFIAFPGAKKTEGQSVSTKENKGRIFPDYIQLVSVMVLYSVFSCVFLTYIATYAVDFLKLSYETGVNIITVFTVGGALFSIGYSILLRRIHGSFFLCFNSLAAIVVVAAGFLIPQLFVRFAMFFIAGGVISITFPLLMGVLGEAFPCSPSLPGFLIMSCSATYIAVPFIVKFALSFVTLDMVMLASYAALIAQAFICVLMYRKRCLNQKNNVS